MKCVHHLVHHVIPLNKDFLYRILPELILSVKEVKEKTRSLAVIILVDIGHLYDQTSIAEYFNLIIAGLAGSAHMISATIISLTRLVYVFHGNQSNLCYMIFNTRIDLLSEEMMKELVKIVTMQLNSKCKEVVKSCLDFAKVSINWMIILHEYIY